MKLIKYKSLAFTSTREEKKEKTNNIEDTNPLEGSLPFTLSDFCDMDESFKEKIRNDSAIKKIVINIVKTYKEIKPDYVYNEIKQTKKCLTYPDLGVYNNNLDNEEHNLIVFVGDIINNYHVIDLLGQGISGRVYEVYHNNDSKNRFAMKIIKNKKIYRNQSLIELKIVAALNKNCYLKSQTSNIINLIDYFFHQEHLCLVFELLNENLYQSLQHNHLQGISLNSINFIIKQLLLAIEQVHSLGIIHCDIKPENVLVKIKLDKDKSDISIKLSDFGSACLKNTIIFSQVQSLFYRAPEVILGIPYTQAIDIWSVGLVTVELFLGRPLIPGYSEYDQLKKIMQLIGKIPDSMLEKANKKIFNFFYFDINKKSFNLREPKKGEIFEDKNDIYNNDFEIPFNLKGLDDILTFKRSSKIKGLEMNNSQNATDLVTFIHFLKCMIAIIPERRWSATQLLNHPFITGEKFESFIQLEPSQFSI